MEVRKDYLVEETRMIDEKEENGGLTKDDRAACQIFKENFERVLSME